MYTPSSSSFLLILSATATISGFTWNKAFFRQSCASSAITATQLNMGKVLDATREKYIGRYDIASMIETEENQQDDLIEYEVFEEAELTDPPKVGQTITGTVIETDDNGALLEITGKMSGYLPIKEASLLPIRHVNEAVEIGQEITAEVIGTLRGMPVISLRTEQLIAAWEKITKLRETDEEFEVQVLETNRGGCVCNVFGLKAFLPGSHIQGQPDESMVGTTMNVKFLDVSEEEGKVVVSQRLALASGAPALEPGAVMGATVTGLRNYGAFVELDGGNSGLLHISQISFERVDNLENVFRLGQRIKVMVLEHDKSNGRVALSTKVLEAKPGEMLRDMENVFAHADANAAKYKERMEEQRLAREESAQDLVAGLNDAIDGSTAGASGVDPMASVAESIESILASIVADDDEGAGAAAPAASEGGVDSDAGVEGSKEQ